MPDQPEEVAEVAVEEAEPDEVIPAFGEEDLALAREEGFVAGKEEGIGEAVGTIQKQTFDALKVISDTMTDLFAQQEQANVTHVRSATRIALGITRKLFPYLNEKNALGEVEHMVRVVMQRFIEEPRIIVHVHPDLRNLLSKRLETLSAGAGYEGTLVLATDEALAAGDCRMEWSAGGAMRDTAAIWRTIDRIIEHNLEISAEEEEEDAVAEVGLAPTAMPPAAGAAEGSDETGMATTSEVHSTESATGGVEASDADGTDADLPAAGDGTPRETARDESTPAVDAAGDGSADADANGGGRGRRGRRSHGRNARRRRNRPGTGHG